MELCEELERVRQLSDQQLLLGLQGALGVQRRSVAEVVAHLGEVEERRLHLSGGYGSMFDYCSSHLHMSEDEAYRRIEVARLVRRFPLLFQKLSRGEISLSVAALLKSHLTASNSERLLADMSGKTVRQAREVLAGWFPQPDVASSIRKLPARQVTSPEPVAQLSLACRVDSARHIASKAGTARIYARKHSDRTGGSGGVAQYAPHDGAAAAHEQRAAAVSRPIPDPAHCWCRAQTQARAGD